MTSVPIVLAEHGQDDQLIVRKAVAQMDLANPLMLVDNDRKLMDYLKGEGPYGDRGRYPMPGLVLMDLNMPAAGGKAALAKIKGDPDLRHIPVVILAASNDQSEINRCYELGASSYIIKPDDIPGFVRLFKEIRNYWFDLSDLPISL